MQLKTNYVGHDAVYQTRRAEGSAGWDPTPESYAEREAGMRAVLQRGFAPRSGRFLELGCGAGNMALWFARQGFQVSGVDIAPTAIRWAQERALAAGIDAQFFCADVLDLYGVLPDASFDFLLDGHCLHCIIGPDRARFLAQAHRLLKPGGFFLVDTMCGPVVEGSIRGYDPCSQCSIFNGVATRYWGDPDQLQQELVDAGFNILDVVQVFEPAHGNIQIQMTRPGAKERTSSSPSRISSSSESNKGTFRSKG